MHTQQKRFTLRKIGLGSVLVVAGIAAAPPAWAIGCRDYVADSMKQVQESQQHNCGFVGKLVNWSGNPNDHKGFCEGFAHGNEQMLNREIATRAQQLAQCEAQFSPGMATEATNCDLYANSAVDAANRNIASHCGGQGGRWTQDRQAHLDWCKGASPALRSSETAARTAALKQCEPQDSTPLVH